MFQIKDWRKKLKINPQFSAQYQSRFVLVVTNTGVRPIGLKTFGFKKWNGEVFEMVYHDLVMQPKIKPEDEIEMTFYSHVRDGEVAQPLLVNAEERKDVYFFFVKATGNKIFKKYPRLYVWSWLVRFSYFTRARGVVKKAWTFLNTPLW